MPKPLTKTACFNYQTFNAPRKIPAAQKIWQDFCQNPPAFAQIPNQKPDPAIRKLAQEKFTTLLIVGIGGSTLTAQTLVQALNPRQIPVYFLADLDPIHFHEICQKINLRRTKVVVISKSGQTLETIAQFLALLPKIAKKNLVLVAAPTQNFCQKFAAQNQLPLLKIPQEVDGRFAAFTTVGLLPAALAGLKIPKFLAGAKAVDPQQAFDLARLQAKLYQQKKSIAICCAYAPQLAKFGEWWTQLLAESLGKVTQQGQRIGLTPVSTLGPAAQHSSLQLWLAGPRDKFFLFLHVRDLPQEVTLGSQLPAEFNFLQQKKFTAIRTAEFQATTEVLKKARLPLAEVELANLTEFSLGQLLQFFLLEIFFLGKILAVNPFGQSAVEAGKKLAREKI